VHCLIGKSTCINKLGNILDDQPEILSYIVYLLLIWASTGSVVLDVLWTHSAHHFNNTSVQAPKGLL